MGPRGSKIDYDGTIRTVFDLKITFPTCVRVKNITFDQFLKIFTNFQKNVEKMIFQNRPKIVLNRSKNQNSQKIKAEKTI